MLTVNRTAVALGIQGFVYRALSFSTEVHLKRLRKDGSCKQIDVLHWGRLTRIEFFRPPDQGGSLCRIVRFLLFGSRQVEKYRANATLKTRVYRNKKNKMTKREIFRLDESLSEVQDFYPETKQLKQTELFNFDKTSRGVTEFTLDGKRQDGKPSNKEQKEQARREYLEELRRQRASRL